MVILKSCPTFLLKHEQLHYYDIKARTASSKSFKGVEVVHA